VYMYNQGSIQFNDFFISVDIHKDKLEDKLQSSHGRGF